MKTRTIVSILILVLAVLIISEGYATEKRITKRDYRFISGTWINEGYHSRYKYAKLVMHPDGTWNGYNRTSVMLRYNSKISWSWIPSGSRYQQPLLSPNQYVK